MTQYITVAADDRVEARSGVIKLHGPDGFEGMRAARSRFSAAIGIESSGSRDSIFQALLGFGTETFESGAALDSIRLVVGARNGF